MNIGVTVYVLNYTLSKTCYKRCIYLFPILLFRSGRWSWSYENLSSWSSFHLLTLSLVSLLLVRKGFNILALNLSFPELESHFISSSMRNES